MIKRAKILAGMLILSASAAALAAAAKDCIVTYTFDDGLEDQYTIAYPMFREAGLPATFFVIGSKIGDPRGMRSKAEMSTPTMTWDMVRKLAAGGMEVASHGWAHDKYSKMDRAAILDDIEHNQRALLENAGVRCVSFAAPYNAKRGADGTDVAALVRESGLVGCRPHQKAAGGSMTAEKMNAMVEKAKAGGEWLIFMSHGMARGYDAWKDPEELRKHLAWVRGREGVRVMSFGDAMRLMNEKAASAGAGSGAVRFDSTGALTIAGDRHSMNWVLRADGSQYPFVTAEDAWGAVAFPGGGGDGIAVERERREDGPDLVESLTLRNTLAAPVSLEGARIRFPFNDNYPDAKECVERRCHAHVWPFGSGAWVCALRIGGEGPHLGWMLTKGELDGYAISKRGSDKGGSNFRGVFSFLLPKRTLGPGESLTLEWRLFSHGGKEDFIKQLTKRGGLFVWADRLVGEVGESAVIRAFTGRQGKVVADVTLDSPGEKIVRVEHGGKWTSVELLGVSSFRGLIEKRLDFVLANQRYTNPDDVRDGAFLPYDNETGELYRDWKQESHRYDLDEGRERTGAGIALAEAVRDMGYANPLALPALEKYAKFIRTALQDENYKTQSEVLRPKHRIYNYAWVARFYFDMFDVTQNPQYLEDGLRTAKAMFREGGHSFYVIDMPVRQSIQALRRAGREADAASLLDDYRKMADNFAANGLLIPKFEVNYEQSIIAPAANFLCETYMVTGEAKYLRAVEAMLPAVDAFNGIQPSWHLNNIAIRHWDAFWFGKRRVWGDTMPHYWSCITADLYGNLAAATGDRRAAAAAAQICKANLGLFTEDGRGGAAWVYPNEVDGAKGRFLEPMANDENYAIAFALRQKLLQ